jgi:hypothetical protein
MKKSITLIIYLIILFSCLLFKDYYSNSRQIDKINLCGNERFSISIRTELEYRKMLRIVDVYKLNITKIEYDANENKTIYAKYNFDVSQYNDNNLYDKYIYLSKKGIIRNTFKIDSTLKEINENKNFKGNYHIAVNNNGQKVIDEFNKNSLDYSLARLKNSADPILDMINFANVVLIVIINFYLYQLMIFKQKELGIIKFYSKRDIKYIKYIFAVDFMNILGSIIIFGLLFILNINNINDSLFYIILQFFVMFIIHFFFYLKDKRKNIITQIKGKIDTFKIEVFYKAVVIIIFGSLLFLILFAFNKFDSYSSSILKRSNWKLYKEYSILEQHQETNLNQSEENKLFNFLTRYNALYFDNSNYNNYLSALSDKETERQSNESFQKIIDDFNNKPSIDVNLNYAIENNLVPKNTVLKDGEMIILATSYYQKQNKQLKNKYCNYIDTYSDIRGVINVNNCQVKVTNNKDFFVGAYINKNESGRYDKAIIRVISDNILKKQNLSLALSMFIKTDKDIDKTFNKLVSDFNSFELVSEKGIYSNFFNQHLDNLAMLKTVSETQLLVSIIIIILFLVILSLIYTFIKLFIISNAKRLLIQKINGISTMRRYQSLIIYLIILFIIDVIGINGYIIVSKQGTLGKEYIMCVIGITILSLLLILFFIKRLENKKLMNIIKGEEL